VDSPLGLQQNVSTADVVVRKAEEGTQPLTKDWAPPDEVEGQDVEQQSDLEKIQEWLTGLREMITRGNCGSEWASSELSVQETVLGMRDACRLIWALRKVAYELKGTAKPEKAKKPEKKVYKAFITVDDQVGIQRLQSRNGRPNAPGSTKRKHFELVNQERGRGSFTWSLTPDQKDPQPQVEPKIHETRRSEAGPQDGKGDQTKPEPHVEPPRPEGRKPLVLAPKILRSQEEVR
jgi:hypothetical protein